ncbi:MAG: polysaccharide biosynthesis protein [Ruminococcaceae bacterium]|nr:polysaccharide biosynthesis protein [Oscillospiraceae bacterium]
MSRKQSFVHGAVLLMASNIIVKLLGAIFKIPLRNLVGVDAMAYFNSAYSFYVLFYMISTAGLPVAISRMVAAANAKGNSVEVKRIFRVSMAMFVAIGAVGTAIMVVFSKAFAASTGIGEGLYLSIIAIAPTLFFICITSSYRGYFQGLQNMIPTSVSQVIEAVGKLGIGLIAGYIAMKAGYNNAQVAAFVILGVTVGVVANTLYLAVAKAIPVNNQLNEDPTTVPRSNARISAELIKIAIPITISSSIMSLTNVIDTMVVVNRLVDIGVSTDLARAYYGSYTSSAVTLFNMPPTLIYPFAISVIPALAASFANKDFARSKGTVESTFRIASLIALPCALGMSALSKPIIDLLFRDENIGTALDGTVITSNGVSGPMLSVLAVAIFFMSMISVTNSVLQAHGKEMTTIISTCAGIVAKFITAYVLIGIPEIGVYGIPVSTALCYLVIMCFNFYFMVRYTGILPGIRKIFLKPLLASVMCGAGAVGVHWLAEKTFLEGKLSTMISILAAVIIYVVVILALKGLDREDVAMLPGGKKISAVLIKYNLI